MILGIVEQRVNLYNYQKVIVVNIEKEIQEIKKRNKKVELNKAWETSLTRRICIMLLTYIVVVLYSFSTDKINDIFLSSLVPVIGFALSNLSLNTVRKIWERKIK